MEMEPFFFYYKKLFLFVDLNKDLKQLLNKLKNLSEKAKKEKREIIVIPINLKPFDNNTISKIKELNNYLNKEKIGKFVNLPPCLIPTNVFNSFDEKINDYFLFKSEEGLKNIKFNKKSCPFYLKGKCDGIFCSDWSIEKEENIKIKEIENYYFIFSPNTLSFLVLNKEEYSLFQKLMKNYNKEYNFFYFLLWRKGIIKINGVSVISSSFPEKFKENYVTIVEIELSNACNLRCKYCYVSAGKDEPIKWETLKKIIDKVLELDTKEIAIQLGGGEALLHFDLIEKAVNYGNKKAREKNKKITWMIQSNGLLLGKFAEKLLKLNVLVGVSYDGPYQDVYRVLPNNKGSRSLFLKSINEARKKGLPIYSCISTIINPKQMFSIYEDLKKNGFKQWKILYYFNAGRGEKNKIEIMNKEQQKEFAKNEFELFKKSLKDGIILKETITKLNNLLLRFRPYVCSKTPCGAGRNFIVFDKNGNIFPCYHFIQQKEFKMGDLKDNWNNLFNSEIRKKLDKRNVNELKECSNCEIKYFCCSGCSSNAFFAYGDLLKKSPMCDYYKKIYILLMKWLKEEYLIF